MTNIERGTIKRIQATVTDSDGNNTDPDQDGGYQITITITNTADDTVEVNAVTMTRSAEGVFYYDWQTETSDTLGQYDIEVSAVVGGNTHLDRDRVNLIRVS